MRPEPNAGVLPQGQAGSGADRQAGQEPRAGAAGQSVGSGWSHPAPGPREHFSFLKINFILTKLNMLLPYHLAIMLLHTYPEDLKIMSTPKPARRCL